MTARRRRTATGVLAAACLLVSGCIGGGTEKGKPDAAPEDVATDIAPPKPTSAQTFAGQSLSEADTKRLTATMTAALRTGDKKKFLSVFDPAMTNLVAQQGTWFDNVRQVPMKQRRIVLVKATDTRDSSGKGDLEADMGFVHQITGADSAPLAEWYSFAFKKQAGRLLVTRVQGAAADESSGEKFSRYYRQPWDDGAMTVAHGRKVLLLGPASDAATLRGLVGRLDTAVEAQVQRFSRNGAALAPDVRKRRWVFMLQSPTVRDVFDYLGGEVKPREADFFGFAMPIFPSDEITGYLDVERSHTSRIVLARDALSQGDLDATIRHEMVHALESTWQEGYGSAPRWAVEGTAVALSDAPSSELSYRRGVGLGYLRANGELPTDDVFYDGGNDTVASRYGAGYVVCAYLAATRGDRGLLKVLHALDDPDTSLEEAMGLSEQKLVKEALAWAS